MLIIVIAGSLGKCLLTSIGFCSSLLVIFLLVVLYDFLSMLVLLLMFVDVILS